MLPRRVPARQRVPDGDLDHDRQPGVLGQRGRERDGVGDVEEHVVTHDHIGDRGQRPRRRATARARSATATPAAPAASTYAVSIVSLSSTPISVSAGGTSTADDRPPPHPTSSTTPPCDGRTSRATRADVPSRSSVSSTENVATSCDHGETAPGRGSRPGCPTRASCADQRSAAVIGVTWHRCHLPIMVHAPGARRAWPAVPSVGSATPTRSRRRPRPRGRRRARSVQVTAADGTQVAASGIASAAAERPPRAKCRVQTAETLIRSRLSSFAPRVCRHGGHQTSRRDCMGACTAEMPSDSTTRPTTRSSDRHVGADDFVRYQAEVERIAPRRKGFGLVAKDRPGPVLC